MLYVWILCVCVYTRGCVCLCAHILNPCDLLPDFPKLFGAMLSCYSFSSRYLGVVEPYVLLVCVCVSHMLHVCVCMVNHATFTLVY